eukprot:CAMPEP_0178414506 /NCGR_PEP_ID=MMETSP0689_2-20121128/23070_1 /TAXON_ID=160604 /ORGANISM="Amphidinium massartii, Strain CS-259" /LENGTH=363 /DNA_ID=CAMNT_0020035795 /DNA_START=78 /DNA_END=1169 /DNA_ORIENTATION=+
MASGGGIKRKASAREMAAREAKTNDAIAAEEAAKEEEQLQEWIKEIGQELQKNKAKVKRAHYLVCKSDNCLPKQATAQNTEPKEAEFSAVYQHAKNVPPGFLHNKVLSKFVPALTPDIMKKLLEKDKKVDEKMLQATLVIGSLHPFGPRLPSEWLRCYSGRNERRSKPCFDLKWSEDFEVMWQETGLYRMSPPVPRGATEDQKKEHRFTEIVFANSIVVPFNEHAAVYDGTAIINENWDFNTAKISKQDGSFAVELKSFCGHKEEFKQFTLPEFSFVEEAPTTPVRGRGKAKAKAAGGSRVAKQIVRMQSAMYGSPGSSTRPNTPSSSSSSVRAPAVAVPQPPPPSGRGDGVAEALQQLDEDE